HAMFPRKRSDPRRYRGAISRIHRAAAVSQLWPLARGAAVGIGFADDDRCHLQLRVRSDHAKPFVDGAQVIADAHAHVTVDEGWIAFGVEGNEIERRAGLASREV